MPRDWRQHFKTFDVSRVLPQFPFAQRLKPIQPILLSPAASEEKYIVCYQETGISNKTSIGPLRVAQASRQTLYTHIVTSPLLLPSGHESDKMVHIWCRQRKTSAQLGEHGLLRKEKSKRGRGVPWQLEVRLATIARNAKLLGETHYRQPDLLEWGIVMSQGSGSDSVCIPFEMSFLETITTGKGKA